MNQNAVKLLLSRAINKLGDVLYDYGNTTFIATMGAVGQQFLGIYQIAELVISILLNPFGGAISDRFTRRKILLWTDGIGALVCLLVAFFPSQTMMIYGLIGVNMALAISSAFSSPSYKAYVPEVVGKDDLVRYNSDLETVVQIIKVSAPLLAYWILQLVGIRMTLVIDSLTFLLSFLALYLIRQPEALEENSRATDIDFKGILSDIWEGFTYIRNKRDIFFLLIIASLVNIFAAMLAYLLPFSGRLLHQDTAYATLLTMAAVGALIGAFLARQVANHMSAMLLFLILSGLGIVIIGLAAIIGLPVYVSYAGNLLSEASMAIFNIHFFSQVQSRVDKRYMGRVISTIYTVAILLMPLGTLSMTLWTSSISLWSFIWIGLGFIVIGLATSYYASNKNGKQ
ncbi:MFS transporter [Streptococcus hillyeri]|uniref:MFS transporter n=1 Tax=Streptococcus hillyeri TaxID=2282420 RepID=A0A3L9E2M0_9STRE|nr:MFS transporter [Streptococcus hillyeri]RLY05400.1 MFS transporter [Streptococcus hillyeri]